MVSVTGKGCKQPTDNEGCEPEAITFRHQLELRYKGQSATISINWCNGGAHEALFHEAHEKASGLRLPHPVEVVNIRLSARAPAVLESINIPQVREGSEMGETIHMPELADEVPIYQRTGLVAGELWKGRYY